jgi:hypothetical protein
MYRDNFFYYGLVMFNVILFGISFYQYHVNPPLLSLSELFELIQANQFKPAILLGLFAGTAFLTIVVSFLSIKRAWYKLSHGELLHGFIAIIFCAAAAACAYQLSTLVWIKYTALIVFGGIIILNILDNDTPRRRRRY